MPEAYRQRVIAELSEAKRWCDTAAAQDVAARQMSGAKESGLEESVAKQVLGDFDARPTVYGDAAKGELLDVAFRVCLRQYLRNT